MARELDPSLGGFVLKVSDEAPPAGVSTVRFDSASLGVDETGASVVVGVPRPHPDNPPVSALGYRFRLLQLDPEPPHSLQSLPFQALLLVEGE